MESIHKPEDHELILRVMPMPADVNANGDIFGGWVMSQVDIAGGVTAAQRARPGGHGGGERVPVQAADLDRRRGLAVRAHRTVGRTSITVHVEVIAERNPTAPVVVKVTEATLTYVAIDRSGVKREIPVR